MSQIGFYNRLKEVRSRSGQPELPEWEKTVRETVQALISQKTDARRPGMLLGKIQSGKTRVFLGVIAAAFDHGFDVAVVLTKGTKTLARQTVRRLSKEFQVFRDAEELAVYDIMTAPTLSAWEIDEQKLVFVAKKETNNMRRLLKLFRETPLKNKRVLIVDDEADLASLRFTKNKDTKEVEQGRIADRIDDLRRDLINPAVLQVTATPYSLYLQPEEYEIKSGANFTFEPKRPAFTKLVPIHSGYVGGDQYFGEHDENETEFYLWHCVELDELIALKKEDRRRVREGQSLTATGVSALRHSLITFVAGACIRRLQQQEESSPLKRYSMIVHIETSRSSHSWQHAISDEIISEFASAIRGKDPIADDLITQSIEGLQNSIAAEGLVMPSNDAIVAAIRDAFSKGAVVTEKVNSDNDVEMLLDDDAELKLRTPFNVFIGGQILDRGITVPNLIGFYYGRSPRRMQQDTVLQHARMYGNRPRADLAVTRFYTTAHNFVALKGIHQFDSALRYAFEENAHERGVAFIHRDFSNRIVPCAPNKIILSDIVALRPGRGYLPFGFQTKPRYEITDIVEQIDNLVAKDSTDSQVESRITTEFAIELLDFIERTIEFEDGYSFDWKACRAAIEYYSRIAAPPADRGSCWLVIKTGRTLSRIRTRTEGRFSDAPATYQDREIVREIGGKLPILMLLRQDGREEDGWRNTPFWWPVFFPPTDATPAVFASTPRSEIEDNISDSDDGSSSLSTNSTPADHASAFSNGATIITDKILPTINVPQPTPTEPREDQNKDKNLSGSLLPPISPLE